MRQNSWLYPVDWGEIAQTIKEANGWCCQLCGRPCRQPHEPFDTWRRTLTVAHISQDYEGAVVQLAPLCAPCHLAYDARHSWIARQRRTRLRRRLAGQLELRIGA